ncbi:MAG TPA: hypothetical protein VGQ47_04125 [Candidatus Limnocylindrales bacterium]|jgi:A/G-specific adenine glycosylase|nr:hypothetical protein [Candidatus Limnocylindrales bacterium]
MALAAWHEGRRRSLAFRETSDPYSVLVAETMAQQTQVGRVDPAWRAFLARFPTPARLAAASPGDVLRAWAGLGYNRRAVHLWRAAREIVEQHGGSVPTDREALEALPGVGPYTSRAVSAVCFGIAVAPLDTNIRRLVGRLLAGYGRPGDPGTPIPPFELQRVADSLVDRAAPAEWVHAAMDLGAAVCRARPSCPGCPLRRSCVYPRLLAENGAVAGRVAGGTAARTRSARPFAATRRWLRGRIVERLRDAPDGAWLVLEGPIGGHEERAVGEAVEGLARDGLLERDRRGRVRLPTSAG